MSIDRLRRLIEVAPQLGNDGDWLAQRLQHYVTHAHEGVTLDQVLGVATPSGSRSWWAKQEREHQREAVRRLAQKTSAPQDRSRAESLRALLSRYQHGRFRFDRARDATDISDPTRRDMHKVLVANDGTTPSRRTLERLLGDCDITSPTSCRSTHGPIPSEVSANESTAD